MFDVYCGWNKIVNFRPHFNARLILIFTGDMFDKLGSDVEHAAGQVLHSAKGMYITPDY